ncbi:hypothetical protein L1887_61790 [Cichorium endivia]|nr:hypothetical protein L1887_61790 [Cichorium endivia]
MHSALPLDSHAFFRGYICAATSALHSRSHVDGRVSCGRACALSWFEAWVRLALTRLDQADPLEERDASLHGRDGLRGDTALVVTEAEPQEIGVRTMSVTVIEVTPENRRSCFVQHESTGAE